MPPETFKCYLVNKDSDGNVSAEVTQRAFEELPPGEALVRTAYSSLNYKDALAATGHPGVAKVFPHVPGLDVAGVVAQSGVYELVEGDRVVIASLALGVDRWGGFAEYVSVPLDWIVPLPEGLTLRESMILGTAGFTAAFCVDTLQRHDIGPDSGEIAVTRASGGVGSVAVALLAKLGYSVVAVTGKQSAHEYLEKLGAAEVIGREEVDRYRDRPMLPARWAGAVDTVGGNILTGVLRSTRHHGCVAACGVAAGSEMSMTVFPFILRGITLAGIDSSTCPDPLRHDLWNRLAGEWKPNDLEIMANVIALEELPERIDEILAGKITGRIVVELGGEQVVEES